MVLINQYKKQVMEPTSPTHMESQLFGMLGFDPPNKLWMICNSVPSPELLVKKETNGLSLGFVLNCRFCKAIRF